MKKLNNIVIINRKSNLALGLDDFGNTDLFKSWKIASEHLRLTLSAYAVADRNGQTDEEMDNSLELCFSAYRAVLKFFEDKSENFKLKPQAQDIHALRDVCGNYAPNNTNLFKTKNASDTSFNDCFVWFANYLQECESKKQTPTDVILKEHNGKTEYYTVNPNTGNEFKPVGEKKFRKGLEDFIADRCTARKAMTAQEIEEEKTARRKARAQAKKAKKIADQKAKEEEQKQAEKKEQEQANNETPKTESKVA